MPHLYLYSSFGAGDNLKQRGHTDFLGPILCLSSDVLWAFKWYCSLSAPSHPLTEIFSGHIYILSSGILTHKTVIPISNKNICPQEQDNLLSEQAQSLKGELFPCWLWPQDVKLALVFSGSHLHSTRLHCKGFFFFFPVYISVPALREKILLLSFWWILLDVCDLCDPPSCSSLARPYAAARTLPRGYLQHWPRHQWPLNFSENQICTLNLIVQKQG